MFMFMIILIGCVCALCSVNVFWHTMKILVGIAEDCAGLGTASEAAHRYLRDSKTRVKVPGGATVDLDKQVYLQHLHRSECNDELREVLSHWPWKNIKKLAEAPMNLKVLPWTHDDMDIYACAFPCQPFSKIGPGFGMADDRTTALKQAVNFVRDHQPKAVVYENVNISHRGHFPKHVNI